MTSGRVAREVEQRAQGVAQHPVRARGPVGLGAHDDPARSGGRHDGVDGLVREARLAHARGAVDGDDGRPAAEPLLQRPPHRGRLLVAAEEGQP